MASAKVVSIKRQVVPGSQYRVDSLVTLPNPYPNPAGVVFTPSDFGLNRIAAFEEVVPANLAAGINTPVVVPTYTTDGQNSIASFALHLIVATTGVEVANGVDLSTSQYLVSVLGV